MSFFFVICMVFTAAALPCLLCKAYGRGQCADGKPETSVYLIIYISVHINQESLTELINQYRQLHIQPIVFAHITHESLLIRTESTQHSLKRLHIPAQQEGRIGRMICNWDQLGAAVPLSAETTQDFGDEGGVLFNDLIIYASPCPNIAISPPNPTSNNTDSHSLVSFLFTYTHTFLNYFVVAVIRKAF